MTEGPEKPHLATVGFASPISLPSSNSDLPIKTTVHRCRTVDASSLFLSNGETNIEEILPSRSRNWAHKYSASLPVSNLLIHPPNSSKQTPHHHHPSQNAIPHHPPHLHRPHLLSFSVRTDNGNYQSKKKVTLAMMNQACGAVTPNKHTGIYKREAEAVDVMAQMEPRAVEWKA